MIGFFKSLLGIKQADTKAEEVPYKVEAPQAPAVTPVSEQAAEAVVTSIAEKPAKKKSAGVKKPTAKKPRKPKAPKV